MVLKLTTLCRGLQGGPEPQLGLCVAGASPAGTKMGQTVGTTVFCLEPAAVLEKRAV